MESQGQAHSSRVTRLVKASRTKLWSLRYEWLAGLVAAVCYMISQTINNKEPLGTVSVSAGDVATQYIPMHLAVRDLLTGSSIIDPMFNWGAGLGVGFIPDFATYASSPFALITLLFPRDRIMWAIFVIMVLRVALMAAAMTALLRSLRPSASGWLAAFFGVCYAMCGWMMTDGTTNFMWIDGAIALPMFCLIGLWAYRRQRAVLGALIIGLAWWSNYYSAYFAAVGAGLFFVGYLVAEATSLRSAAMSLVRMMWTAATGIALTGIIFVPTFIAARRAAPLQGSTAHAIDPELVVGRLFTGVQANLHAPGLAVGTIPLILWCALPFVSKASWRVRLSYFAIPAFGLFTLWHPGLRLIWSAGEDPHGSVFRTTVAVSALILISAWVGLSDGVAPGIAGERRWLTVTLPIVLSSAVVFGIYTWAMRHASIQALVQPHCVRMVVAMLVVVGLASILVWLRPKLAGLLALLLVLSGVVEVTAGLVAGEEARLSGYIIYPDWDDRLTKVAPILAAIPEAERFPHRRIDQDFNGYTNDAIGWGQAGVQYYSSLLPGRVAETYGRYGIYSIFGGRAWSTTHEPVRDALFGVSQRLSGSPQFMPRSSYHVDAFPLVRTVAEQPTPSKGLSPTFFLRQELLAPDTYVPAVTRIFSGEQPEKSRVEATCPAHFVAQVYTNKVIVPLTPVRPQQMIADHTWHQAVVTLGTSPDGVFEFLLDKPDLKANEISIACLDSSSLQRQTQQAQSSEPTQLSIHGSRIDATWARPIDGKVLISTVAQPGWSCQADGKQVEVSDRSELLLVDAMGARQVSCRYVQPHLGKGVAVSVLGLVLLMCPAVFGWLRRRIAARR